LFLAALFDADSLVAAVSSERFGTARTVELSLVRPFKSVSDALGINLPHRWLANVAGTNEHNPAPVEVPQQPTAVGDVTPTGTAAALPGSAPGRLVPHRPPHAAGSRPGGTSAVTPVRVVTPTAAAPLKVWLAGDSMIGAIADAFMADVAGNRAVVASENLQIGTGLARPDVYNWPGLIAQEMQKAQPSVVVLTFGANDDQDMVAGGHYFVRNTPAWQAEYARRVALIMSEVAGPGRLLVWLETPPMGRAHLQQSDVIINAILRAQARVHPGVVLVDPGPVLAPGGVFTLYLAGSSGHPVQVRDSDGVHLTPAGASRVLPLVLRAIGTRWRLG
jgi:hypothetical protein